MVVRVHGDEWVVPAGETISVEQISEHGRSSATAEAPAAASTTAAPAVGAEDPLETAIAGGDVARALALLLERLQDDDMSSAELTSVRSQLARTIAALGEPVDATETLSPLVALVLDLRAQARAEKRWAESDTIRDGLAAAGIEVRDTADGAEWEVRR